MPLFSTVCFWFQAFVLPCRTGLYEAALVEPSYKRLILLSGPVLKRHWLGQSQSINFCSVKVSPRLSIAKLFTVTSLLSPRSSCSPPQLVSRTSLGLHQAERGVSQSVREAAAVCSRGGEEHVTHRCHSQSHSAGAAMVSDRKSTRLNSSHL